MCAEYIVAGQVCRTQQELADALGIKPSELRLRPDYPDDALSPGGCLCPIETAAEVWEWWNAV